MKRHFLSKIVATLLGAWFLTTDCLAASQQVVNSLYYYAQTNQPAKIRWLLNQGYNIDEKSDEGWTAYCIADKREDDVAKEILVKMGASRHQICCKTCVLYGTLIAGAVIAGGTAIAMAGGGGGGGGDSDKCSGVKCQPNASCHEGICSCNSGFIEQGGKCYRELTCPENEHQEEDSCVCDSGYNRFLPDNACYEIKTCNAHEHQEADSCICDNGYGRFIPDNACYEVKNCGSHQHQEGDSCVCDDPDYRIGSDGKCYRWQECDATKNLEWKDGVCVCKEGFPHRYDDTCYADLGCAANSHQEKDECICDSGYNRFAPDNACYEIKNCGSYQHQVGDECVCDDPDYRVGSDGKCYRWQECDATKNLEWQDGVCVCKEGFPHVYNGACYAELECDEHSEQQGDQCVCESGYDHFPQNASDTKCYRIRTDCDIYQHQVGDECVCISGYKKGSDGRCYPDIPCDATKNLEWKDGVCVCKEGYSHQYNGACYEPIDCHANSEQQGDQCVCLPGYAHFPDSDPACYRIKDCSEAGAHRKQVGNECLCDEPDYREDEEDGQCYMAKECNEEEHRVWKKGECVCMDTYLEQGGVCKSCEEAKPNSEWDEESKTCTCPAPYYKEKDGACKTCEEAKPNSQWDAEVNDCVCSDENYPFDGGNKCYVKLACELSMGEHSHQVVNAEGGTECVCDDGYEKGEDGKCYLSEDCDPDGTLHKVWKNGECVCASGYTEADDGKCYVTGDCSDKPNSHWEPLPEPGKCACDDDYYEYDGQCYNVTCYAGGTPTGDPEHPCDCTGTNAHGDLCELCNYGFGHDSNMNCVLQAADYQSPSKTNFNVLQNTSTDNNYRNYYAFYYDNTWTDATTVGDPKDMYNNYAITTSENSTVTGIAGYSITKESDGNVYGMYSPNADIYNGYINVTHQNITVENFSAYITISYSGNGKAYGIYGNGDITNYYEFIDDSVKDTCTIKNSRASISVSNTNIYEDGKDSYAYGIYSAGGGTVINNGTITVSSEKGYAYGIYAVGGTVINNKTITVSGIDGQAFGIYATSGATVENHGTITVNGSSCSSSNPNCTGSISFGAFIVLQDGARVANLSLFTSMSSLDFTGFGGETQIGQGGVFEAPEISGPLTVATSVVTDGFEDTYTLSEALRADKIDVTAHSASALFDSTVSGRDIVSSRRSFADVSTSASIAEYLEANYAAHNNESLFRALKATPTASAYRKQEAEALGYNLIPNFSQENMRILRSLNETLTDDLFTKEGEERKIVGYDTLYFGRDEKGTLTGYENWANSTYFMYDREDDNLVRKGIGMSITRSSSDYDEDSTRKSVMFQGLVPVSYKLESGLKLVSLARFGYGDGHYKRRTANGTFESDTSEWLYGLSNAARYATDVAGVTVEPTVELNVLGYYENRFREDKGKDYALRTEGMNDLSVESGLGFNIRKAFAIDEKSKLKLKAGAMYYHEFAHPYHSMDAHLHGTTGTYKLRDYENLYDRDRGVIKAGADYDWGSLSIYGTIRAYLEHEFPFSFNAGLKYRF